MSDNTFHIYTTHPLASEAAPIVATYSPHAWVAIRGEFFEWDDGEICEEHFYGVSSVPDPREADYVWNYVKAGEWLAAYNAVHA